MSAEPLSVVHVIDELPPDGAERLIVDLMRCRDGGVNYRVLCLVQGGVLEAELRDIGIQVDILGKRTGLDLSIIPKLIRWFKAEKVDVVHTHLFTADLWARLAARLAGVPAIFSTSHSENNWKSGVHRFLDRRMAGISTKVIACTDQVSGVLVERDGIASERVEVIANGIDLSRFESAPAIDFLQEFGVPANRCCIGVIGRYHPVKGHLYFLDVFAAVLKKLAEQGASAHLFYIGEGDLRADIEARISERKLGENVTLTGFRNDVPAVLSALDLVAVPSELEGLPMVVLEAMSQGKPVVAHDVGGIRDVISDPGLGRVVSAQDQSAMTAQLVELASSAELRQQIGSNAKEKIQHSYDAKKTLAAYEALYRQAME